jgi:hypothetical protein
MTLFRNMERVSYNCYRLTFLGGMDWVCYFGISLAFFRIIQYNTDAHTSMHTQPYEYMYANPNPMSTFEGLSQQISRFMKSPLAPRYRWGRRLPLRSQRIIFVELWATSWASTGLVSWHWQGVTRLCIQVLFNVAYSLMVCCLVGTDQSGAYANSPLQGGYNCWPALWGCLLAFLSVTTKGRYGVYPQQ